MASNMGSPSADADHEGAKEERQHDHIAHRDHRALGEGRGREQDARGHEPRGAIADDPTRQVEEPDREGAREGAEEREGALRIVDEDIDRPRREHVREVARRVGRISSRSV